MGQLFVNNKHITYIFHYKYKKTQDKDLLSIHKKLGKFYGTPKDLSVLVHQIIDKNKNKIKIIVKYQSLINKKYGRNICH